MDAVHPLSRADHRLSGEEIRAALAGPAERFRKSESGRTLEEVKVRLRRAGQDQACRLPSGPRPPGRRYCTRT